MMTSDKDASAELIDRLFGWAGGFSMATQDPEPSQRPPPSGIVTPSMVVAQFKRLADEAEADGRLAREEADVLRRVTVTLGVDQRFHIRIPSEGDTPFERRLREAISEALQ